jgi:hypothetical protein
LSRVELSVVSEIPLFDESFPLWPTFFPFFVDFISPNLHFAIFTSLQVTLKLAIKVQFLFSSAVPPFSHNEEGKKSEGEKSDGEKSEGKKSNEEFANL